MEIIKIEKVQLSNKEFEAFELVKKCLGGIVEASSNPRLRETASSTLIDLYTLDDYIEEVVDEEPTEEYCWEKEYCEDKEVIEEVEEPTEEHCWDERHIPSQFELNP